MSLADDNEQMDKLTNYDKRWSLEFDNDNNEWVYINKTRLDRYEAVELAHWVMQTFGQFEPIQSPWSPNQVLTAQTNRPTRTERLRRRLKEWLK